MRSAAMGLSLGTTIPLTPKVVPRMSSQNREIEVCTFLCDWPVCPAPMGLLRRDVSGVTLSMCSPKVAGRSRIHLSGT